MTYNNQYYKDVAQHAADPICKECEKQIFPYIEDNTQAFDCGSRLKGPEDIKVFPACEEFPEGCEPDKCSRNIIVTADELDDWLLFAEKTMEEAGRPQGLKFINLELLIDKIREKLVCRG